MLGMEAIVDDLLNTTALGAAKRVLLSGGSAFDASRLKKPGATTSASRNARSAPRSFARSRSRDIVGAGTDAHDAFVAPRVR